MQEMGYGLADLELIKEGVNWYLRFYIEHEDPADPVDILDCQRVSERLSDWLDETDPIPQAYFLEVSSPGIERPLKSEKDFIRYQGAVVRVDTSAPIDGKTVHIGLLGPVTAGELTLIQEKQDVVIQRNILSGIHLYWDEEEEG